MVSFTLINITTFYSPNCELVIELVAAACLLHLGVELHEAGGEALLAQRMRHDPGVHLPGLVLDQ